MHFITSQNLLRQLQLPSPVPTTLALGQLPKPNGAIRPEASSKGAFAAKHRWCCDWRQHWDPMSARIRPWSHSPAQNAKLPLAFGKGGEYVAILGAQILDWMKYQVYCATFIFNEDAWIIFGYLRRSDVRLGWSSDARRAHPGANSKKTPGLRPSSEKCSHFWFNDEGRALMLLFAFDLQAVRRLDVELLLDYITNLHWPLCNAGAQRVARLQAYYWRHGFYYTKGLMSVTAVPSVDVALSSNGYGGQ